MARMVVDVVETSKVRGSSTRSCGGKKEIAARFSDFEAAGPIVEVMKKLHVFFHVV